MTSKTQSSIDHYENAQKRAFKDPELKRALEIVIFSLRTWANAGWESSSPEAAYMACIKWFYNWDTGGRVGGLLRFRHGLKMALRFGCCKVIPGSYRVVQGVTDEGLAHFDKSKGPFLLPSLDAAELVKAWNIIEKEANSCYRFRQADTKRPSHLNLRRIKRYEIELIKPLKTLSLDKEEEMRGHARSLLWSTDEQYAWEDVA